MNTIQTTKGRARIYVGFPREYWPDGVKIPVAGHIYYDVMEVKELFDAWHKFLLLPESYVLTGVFYDVTYGRWVLIVESDAIPLPSEGEMIPVLTPRHQVEYLPDGSRKVSLTDLVLQK